MTNEARPLPFFDEAAFRADFLAEIRDYGLTDEDLGGWSEAKLAQLFYAARDHGLDPGRLGTWMRELGDPDAVWERWMQEQRPPAGRDDDEEDDDDEDDDDEDDEDDDD